MVSQGKVDLITKILQHPKGAKCLMDASADGMTPLMYAALRHQPKTIKYLLAARIDPNATVKSGDQKGWTALHFALSSLGSYNGRAPRFLVSRTQATVEALLISDTIDVGVIDENKNTPYSMAQHNPRIQQSLVEHPSFRPSTLPEGVPTPLDLAVETEDREQILELLKESRHLEVIQRKGVGRLNPAAVMCRIGMTDVLQNLVESGSVDPWPRSGAGFLLGHVWLSRDQKLLDTIVERLPDTISLDQFLSIVKMKSDLEPDFSPFGYDLEDDVFDTCLERLEDRKKTLEEALHCTAQLGNRSLFYKLISAGADPEKRDAWGRTIWLVASDRITNLSSDSYTLEQLDPPDPSPQREDECPLPSSDVVQWREILTKGDLAPIQELLSTMPEGQWDRKWGRMPADFVPDAIQDDVRHLQNEAKSCKGGLSRWIDFFPFTQIGKIIAKVFLRS